MKKIYIFGDSHCRMFFGQKESYKQDEYIFLNKYRSKSSLKGLGNLQSKSGTRQYILDTVKNIRKTDIICLKFGQVDLEYVFYYKKYVKNEVISFEDFAYQIVDVYISFIKCLKIYCQNICVISPNLPNPRFYSDTINKSIGVNIDVDHSELCSNFYLFNQILGRHLKQHKISFLDLHPIIGVKTGHFYTMKKSLVGLDHHIKGAEHKNTIQHQKHGYGEPENAMFMNVLKTHINSVCF